MPGEKGAISEIPRQDGGSVSYVERRWRRLKRDSGKILKTQLFPAFNPIPGMDLVNSFSKFQSGSSHRNMNLVGSILQELSE